MTEHPIIIFLKQVFPCDIVKIFNNDKWSSVKCVQNGMNYFVKIYPDHEEKTCDNEIYGSVNCCNSTAKFINKFVNGKFIFSVYEFLDEYYSLFDIISKDIKTSKNDDYKIALNLMNCIKNVHSKNIVHRDIKPGNIMVNLKTNDVKLIDFEFSSHVSNYDCGKLKGTYDFVDPILAYRCETHQQIYPIEMMRFDIFSYGITMFQFLSRSQSFSELETNDCHISHDLKILNKFPSMCLNLDINIFPCFSFDTETGKIDYKKFPLESRQWPKF